MTERQQTVANVHRALVTLYDRGETDAIGGVPTRRVAELADVHPSTALEVLSKDVDVVERRPGMGPMGSRATWVPDH